MKKNTDFAQHYFIKVKNNLAGEKKDRTGRGRYVLLGKQISQGFMVRVRPKCLFIEARTRRKHETVLINAATSCVSISRRFWYFGLNEKSDNILSLYVILH